MGFRFGFNRSTNQFPALGFFLLLPTRTQNHTLHQYYVLLHERKATHQVLLHFSTRPAQTVRGRSDLSNPVLSTSCPALEHFLRHALQIQLYVVLIIHAQELVYRWRSCLAQLLYRVIELVLHGTHWRRPLTVCIFEVM